MDEKLNIIQFMPYFPPHKGGLETVGEEMGFHWCKNGLGEFINISTHFDQRKHISDDNSEFEKIIFEQTVIGYKKNGYEVLVCPSIEIINNFPIYKIWDGQYKLITNYLKLKIGNDREHFRIITHTRFFLTSLVGGLFAKKNHIKWVHVEHGSDYVKLSSKLKTKLSFLYDKIFGRWVFKKSDSILAISEACKNFIIRDFVEREVDVFYRGLEINNNIKIEEDLNILFKGKLIIGYIGRLYKWKNVESLIKAYYLLDQHILNKLQLVVVGSGEDYQRLKLLDTENKIYFTGGKTFNEALSYQKQFDVHIHSSSSGGGLATTLLQAMNLGCMIIATSHEGAKEVITNNQNGFLLKNDSVEEIKRGIELGLSNIQKKEDFFLENKKIIEKRFSWENNILKLYKLVKCK